MMTLAQEAAKRAGEVLREHFGRASIAVSAKGPADYVTDVDRRAEDVIRAFLEAELPGHAFLLEEAGAHGPPSDYEWAIDPLDGTTNYIHRYPFFSVSLGLRHRGAPVLGLVYDPLRGEMFTAEKGEGAHLNSVALSVSRTPELRGALVCTGFPFRSRPHLDPYLDCFRQVLLAAGDLRRDGSAALDLAYVAAGRYDAFWELGLKPWDTSAGCLLVAEAGGRVTDFHGGSGAVDGGDVIASNALVHGEILAVTSNVFAAGRPSGREIDSPSRRPL